MKILKITDKVEGMPWWIGYEIQGLDKPVLLNRNWHGQRMDKGLELPKVGDEVEFEIDNATTEFFYVRNFRIVQ